MGQLKKIIKNAWRITFFRYCRTEKNIFFVVRRTLRARFAAKNSNRFELSLKLFWIEQDIAYKHMKNMTTFWKNCFEKSTFEKLLLLKCSKRFEFFVENELSECGTRQKKICFSVSLWSRAPQGPDHRCGGAWNTNIMFSVFKGGLPEPYGGPPRFLFLFFSSIW